MKQLFRRLTDMGSRKRLWKKIITTDFSKKYIFTARGRLSSQIHHRQCIAEELDCEVEKIASSSKCEDFISETTWPALKWVNISAPETEKSSGASTSLISTLGIIVNWGNLFLGIDQEDQFAPLSYFLEIKSTQTRPSKSFFILNKKWEARPRLYCRANLEAVRWLRLLHFALTGKVQMTARLDAAYWWQIVAVNIIRQNHLELIDLPEWEGLPSEKIIRARLQQADLPLAVVGSIPDWLQEFGEHAFGEHWQAELAALNSPAPVILRCNRLKTSPEALLQALHKEQIDCSVFQQRLLMRLC